MAYGIYPPAGGAGSPPLNPVVPGSGGLLPGTTLVDSTSGPVALQLPNPATVKGTVYNVKDIGGQAIINNISLVPFASETIEGLAQNYLFPTAYFGCRLMSDGSNWWLL